MSIFSNLEKYTKDIPPESKVSTKSKTDDKKLSIFSRMLLHGGNASDAGSTIYGLKQGAVEANPVWGSAPSPYLVGGIKAGTSLAEDVGLSKLAKSRPKLANGLAKGIGIGMLAVAASNMHQAKK
jgi:hypothetical protein